MILGVGIDAIETKRFHHWYKKSPQQLSKIFSVEEITYCLKDPALSAQRFAARFAAKEAFLKAHHHMIYQLTQKKSSLYLLAACKLFSTIKPDELNLPIGKIAWNELKEKALKKTTLSPPFVHISLSHTKTTATAIVTLSM